MSGTPHRNLRLAPAPEIVAHKSWVVPWNTTWLQLLVNALEVTFQQVITYCTIYFSRYRCPPELALCSGFWQFRHFNKGPISNPCAPLGTNATEGNSLRWPEALSMAQPSLASWGDLLQVERARHKGSSWSQTGKRKNLAVTPASHPL